MTSSELFDMLKQAEEAKSAEISKEIPPEETSPVGKTLSIFPRKKTGSRRISSINSLRSGSKALSTTAGMGIVLRPSEFQRVILGSLGRRDLADSMDQLGHVFFPYF